MHCKKRCRGYVQDAAHAIARAGLIHGRITDYTDLSTAAEKEEEETQSKANKEG